MNIFFKLFVAAALGLVAFTTQASSVPDLDSNPQMAYEDIMRSLPGMEPIIFKSPTERHRLLVFIDNQCVYCSYVVKNVKKYNDAGLTMAFVTVAPPSIKDSVIEDMARVWCASDRPKSLQKAMAGFLPDNDSSEKCKNLVIKQSELADRLSVTVTPAMVVMDKSAHVFLGSVSPEKILSELR